MSIRIAKRILHPAILASVLLGGLVGMNVGSVRAEEEGGKWYCPIESFTNGNCGCSNAGCKKTAPEGGYVCSFQVIGGSGCSCPPLEACEQSPLIE